MIRKVESCIEIAPLHNPPNLAGIYAISEMLPLIPQVAVFDTAFHQTMPEYTPWQEPPIRFIKIRYQTIRISRKQPPVCIAESMWVPGLDFIKKTKSITAHIGNGASIAAIENGKSVGTMGFTPVEGLNDGNSFRRYRSGSGNLSDGERNDWHFSSNHIIQQTQPGVLGVCRVFRRICAISKKQSAKAINGQNWLWICTNTGLKIHWRICRRTLNGFDVLVFTGGVGENQTQPAKKYAKD